MTPRPLRATLGVVALAAAATCAAAGEPPAGEAWSLRLPTEQQVAFRGTANFDSVGAGTAALVYPAPTPAAFLAAVLTHGVLLTSDQENQKKKLQNEADKALDPYRPAIDRFTHRALLARALERTTTAGQHELLIPEQAPATPRWVESAPVFSISPDGNAVVLDNAVVVHGPSAGRTYRNLVRVVSDPRNENDPVTYWTTDSGHRLFEESAGLVAESLDIALADAERGDAPDSHPQKTVRYLEGGAERIERVQVLARRCNRMLLRTLRGHLLSVPATPATTESCGERVARTD